MPVIAIIDAGKTNKKLLLFDREYRVVYEQTARLAEIADEDGDPCEDLNALCHFVLDSLQEVFNRSEYNVIAINVAAYGASLVYINEKGLPVAPLYSYLKPYPEALKKQFYRTYGGEIQLSLQTASPVLGSLNSGLQIYRIKQEQPELFRKIKYALHLPQYISFLVSGRAYSDITSIGSHTHLWDFTKNDYHNWVRQEEVINKLAPVVPSDQVIPVAFSKKKCLVGTGLHDSSAALIPYLINFHEPFVLLSTGTWCISLNPFNKEPLTPEELQQDCLCYLQYQGSPVKASRFFAGQVHEDQVRRIAEYFHQHTARYQTMEFQPGLLAALNRKNEPIWAAPYKNGFRNRSVFEQRDLSSFATDDEAYHQLISDIVDQQYHSTQLVLKGTSVKQIFVDGGFSKNAVYMNLLAASFPQMKVFAASMPQATAVGAALAIHRAWNPAPPPDALIELRHYAFTQETEV